MIDFKKLVTDELLKLAPYKPGKPLKEVQRESGISEVVKLASNENPIGPSKKAIKALEDFLPEVSRYPLGDSYYLRKAISEKYNVSMDEILCGAGSDEIIQLLYIAFLQKGKNAVSPRPSFSEYYILAKSIGADCKWVESNSDLTVNFENVLNTIDENTRFVFFANPNNPTGLAFGEKELVDFLDKVPSDVIVAMDEAYIEFAERSDMPDSIKLMKKYKNLIIMRTFSKAYGLASLRCGFLIADKECIDVIQRVRPPFNVSMPAQVMAEAALKDDDHINMVVAENNKGKKYIYSELDKMGIEYVETEANFMLVKTYNGQKVFEDLLKEGVIVRFLGDKELVDYVRVSVGTMKENEIFIKALKKVLNK